MFIARVYMTWEERIAPLTETDPSVLHLLSPENDLALC